MKSFALLAAAAAAVTALVSPLVAGESTGGHPWGYSTANTSVAAPDKWAMYYDACGGSRQSPVDLAVKSCDDVSESPLSFAGECSNYKLTESHESYKGAVVGGTCTVTSPSATYNLLQFHVHAPSEHTINGKAMDGEAHFVHSNADGSALLVVGLFLKAKPNAETDAFFTDLLAGIDSVAETTPVNLALPSYSELLESKLTRGHLFNYPGSLTTPGCSEIVDWWVINKPLKIATEDLARLQEHFKEFSIYDEGKNARPVQPLNGRTITAYTL